MKNGAPLPAVFQKALARERCRGRGKLHIFNDEGILARKQERAEKSCAAAEVADRVAARGAGKVSEGKAVRSRRKEGGIVVKAGAVRPEFVALFHAMLLSDDKNKDARKRVLIF